MMSVEESVYLANVENYGKPPRSMNMRCPNACPDLWRTRHGISSEFASEYNPGEYVDFICAGCGFTDRQGS